MEETIVENAATSVSLETPKEFIWKECISGPLDFKNFLGEHVPYTSLADRPSAKYLMICLQKI
jgi:hypothetical protein